jgi:succinate dehydrogenase/fumarate reductase cytochrome b subunit
MLKNKKLIIALSIIPQYFFVKLLSLFPEFIEDYYSKGMYVFTSKLFRYILGWMPFSLGDVVYILAMMYAVRWLYKHRKQFVKNTKSWFVDVFAVISIFYFTFHVLWGMNYYRLPLHKSLNLDADYTYEQLVTVTKQLIAKSNAIHLEITNNDSIKVDIPLSKTEILKQTPSGYADLKFKFPDLEYHPKSIKTSLFGLPLTYMGFSGYLNPLSNEAQIDGKIPVYKFPTTASHEIAHQLGFAAENEANFIGCMAAISHNNIYFKYSGYTFALRHCLNEIYRRDEILYNEIVESVNLGILKNYQEVREFWERYQNPMEPIFKIGFNAFLKANNQDKGMESYSYVVALLVNYLESNKI